MTMNDEKLIKIFSKSKNNFKKIWNLKDSHIIPIHDIQDCKYNSDNSKIEIIADDNDPIIYLPDINYSPDKNYIIVFEGLTEDPNWQIFYKSKPNQMHSDERYVNIYMADDEEQHIMKGIGILPKALIPQQLRVDPGSQKGKILISDISVYEVDENVKNESEDVSPIYKRCNDMDTNAWSNMLKLSVNHPEIGDMIFPSFPEESIQIGMVGSSGVNTIGEMSKFYSELRKTVDELSWVFNAKTRILDFGCGFGRLTRFFLKDTSYGNLYGTDTVEVFCQICRRDFPSSVIPKDNFMHNEALPPLDFESSTFDLITAYSVFTHLNENTCDTWINEFHRILKPGGLLAITVRQKNYLEYCHRLTKQDNLSGYYLTEAKMFGDMSYWLPKYESGEFLHVASGGGDHLKNTFYGDSVIPPIYIKKHWTKNFRIRKMFDDNRRVAQGFLVLQAI